MQSSGLRNADRFINLRSPDNADDPETLYGTKIQLFAKDLMSNSEEARLGQSQNVNEQQRKESSLAEEENRKVYTALLQNQVLRVENKQLLHEIHNAEDNMMHHQRQQANQDQDMQDCFRSPDESNNGQNNNLANSSASMGANYCNTSPFSCKFSVLKFSASKTNSNKKVTQLPPRQKPTRHKTFYEQPVKARMNENDTTPIKHINLFDTSQNKLQDQTNKMGSLASVFGSPGSTPNDFFAPLQMNRKKSLLDQEPKSLALEKQASTGFTGSQENSNPGGSFALSPFGGFDEDQLYVPSNKQRPIAKTPYKVLDAPALQDDFYLNLVDWSCTNNLAVGLSSCVYIWSASSSRVTKLHDLSENQDSVTSVCWSKRGSHLSVGTNSGAVHIWDINKMKLVRELQGHQDRVGALAWSTNVLSSGSKDKHILNRDLRDKNDYFAVGSTHRQEVCGLKWSHDEQQLASGGNDNRLLIWQNQRFTDPIFKFSQHQAAVKALAWSPHQSGLLASGGGTADRCIRFWNTNQGLLNQTIHTGSQVCNLLFSKTVKNELVSTHGYSENAVVVWKYPSMKKLATLTGHSMRVLYLAMSPQGDNIVTGAGDETLRFWKIFPEKKKANKPASALQPNAKVAQQLEGSSFVIR